MKQAAKHAAAARQAEANVDQKAEFFGKMHQQSQKQLEEQLAQERAARLMAERQASEKQQALEAKLRALEALVAKGAQNQ